MTSGDGSDRDLITRTVYDRGGNVVQTSDPLGRVTAFGYDQLDRLIQVTENQLATGCGGGATDCNIVTRYHYDRAGNRVAITDARTNVRRVQYDAADRPTLATDALSRTTSWTYSLRGEQLTRTDSRGTVTSTYDALGRQSTMSATGGTLTQSWSYADELGRLTTWGDHATPAGTTGLLTYGYDALNRTTSIADPRTGTVAATYTARGQRASLTYPDSTVVNYAYTTAGELDTVTQNLLTLADYSYDSQGRLASLTRHSGLIQTSWTYDQADRVTDLLTTVGLPPLPVQTRSRFQYTLDRRGQRTAVTDTVGATSLTTSYGYDGLARLTSATETGGSTYGYTYDTVGNRLSATVNGTTTSRTYDAANQVSGWTYDTAGNLTSDGTSSYTYDLLNRLSSVTKAGTTTNFGYHGEELIQQATGGTTTKFVQDRMGGLSQVLQTLQGGTTTTFAYGLDRLSTLTGATRTWDMADALGSVHGSLDNLGALVTSQQYDPWGQPTGTNQPAPFGFTGEYQDGVSGLVYLRARWYHPGQGTLLGRDPFEGWATAPNSLHPYMYGANNPVTYGDPSGECYGPLDWLRWIENTNCTNLDSAIRIVNTPTTSTEGKDFAWRYIAIWTAAHIALLPALVIGGAKALAIASTGGLAAQVVAWGSRYLATPAVRAAGTTALVAMSGLDDLMMTATMAVSDDPNDIADAQAWYGVSAADGQLPFADGLAFCGILGVFGKGFMKRFNKLFRRGSMISAGTTNRATKALVPVLSSGLTHLDNLVMGSIPGNSARVRLVPGTTAVQAENSFRQIADPSSIAPHPNPTLANVGGLQGDVPGGGRIYYRPYSSSGPPTIDIHQVPSYASYGPRMEIKFVP